MNFNKLNKDMLIKIITESNDLSKLNIKELEEKQEEINSLIILKKIQEEILKNDEIDIEKIKLIEKVEKIEYERKIKNYDYSSYVYFYIEGKKFSCEITTIDDPYLRIPIFKGDLLEILPGKIIDKIAAYLSRYESYKNEFKKLNI